MVDRIVVAAPVGKLGILVVDNNTNEVHTVISKVNDDSPLAGKVFGGDQIVSLNGIDVHRLDSVSFINVFQQQRGKKKTIVIARSIPDAITSNGHGRKYHAGRNSAARRGEAVRFYHAGISSSAKGHASSTSSGVATPASAASSRSSREKNMKHWRDHTSTTAASTKADPFQLDSSFESGPPNPVEMAFDGSMAKKTTASSGKLDVGTMAQDRGPHAPPQSVFDDSMAKKKRGSLRSGLKLSQVSPNDEGPPLPPSLRYDDSMIKKIAAGSRHNASNINAMPGSRHAANISNQGDYAPRSYLEVPQANDEVSNTSFSTYMPRSVGRHHPIAVNERDKNQCDIPDEPDAGSVSSKSSYSNSSGSSDSVPSESNGGSYSTPSGSSESVSSEPSGDIEQGTGTGADDDILANAVLVDDQEVYDAECMPEEQESRWQAKPFPTVLPLRVVTVAPWKIAVITLLVIGVGTGLGFWLVKDMPSASDFDDSSHENSWYDDVDDNAWMEDTFWDETYASP